MEIKTLDDIRSLVAQGMSKEQALFHKLGLCLAKIYSDHDRLGCHTITTVMHMGRCIESNYTYYDPTIDAWCDYFLS